VLLKKKFLSKMSNVNKIKMMNYQKIYLLRHPVSFNIQFKSLSNNKNIENIITMGTNKIDKALDNTKIKVFEVMSIYEEAIGLKEIKEAQQSVLEVNIF